MSFWWNRFQFGTGRDDVLFGTDFNDIVFAFAGNDLISTGLGHDQVFAGRGNDSIDTGAGNDLINAGRGDDEIVGGAGDDRISGGRGFDVVTYEGGVSDYEISSVGRWTIVNAIAPVADAGRDRLKSVEALFFAQDDYTLFLDGQNNAVLAGDDAATTDEDTGLVLAATELLSNDQEFDGDTISITGVDATSAAGAQVSFDGVSVTYTPGSLFDTLQAGETATDTFDYTVDDGKGGSDTATVTVTITGVNDGPVLVASDATIDENTTAVAAGVSATDVDSATLTFALSGADAGLFDIDAGTGAISFLAAPDFEAPADADADNAYDLTVEVSDGDGGLATQDITVTVADVAEFDGRINEFHYDNTGGDTGEFVEVRVAAGTDVTNALVELYNGSNGSVYNTLQFGEAVQTTDGTFDYYIFDLPSNGLQNGAPDGLALSDNGSVIEFLSYEGSFSVVGGTADGLTSTDIGVFEPGDTPIGFSLQRNADGTWRAPEEESKGLDNDFVPPFAGRINELHYDNTGGDTGEFVEVRVDAGADVSDVSIELYNGNGGGIYASAALSAGDKTTDGVFDYYVLDINDLGTSGIQNGSPDGLALVDAGTVLEFLSYEGAFTASSGTAAGLTSTDIGVSEPGSTPIGQSLQRNEDGTWRAPEAETPGATNDPATPFAGRINELHYDNDGGDVGEFIEVRVDKGADISQASVELYNGNGGSVYNTLELSDATKTSDDAFDYYVFNLPANGLQNGSPDGLALINDGAVVEFLSYEGTLTASNGTAAGQTSTDIGVAESGSTQIGESLQRKDDGSWEAPAAETPGAANDGSGGGGGGGTGGPLTLISAIQGTGAESTFVGDQVTVSAIVTYVASNGFFLQEEDTDADADAATSEGIFVFTDGGVAVSLGDLVEVSGMVAEFRDETQISSVSATTVISSGNIAPTAASIMLDPAVAQDFEAVEGMLVTVSSGTTDPLTVIENFNLDRFGEITISAGRQTQPTQLFDAQDEAAEVAALAEANLNNRIAIDDGFSSQNPTEFDYLPGGAGDNGNGFLDSADDFGDAGSTLRLGSELTADVEGVLDFSFGEFKVLTTERLQIDETTNVGARDAAPADVGGDLQVASFNVLNYFTTFSGQTLGGVGVRGADNQDELDRQTTKIVQAMEGTGADVFALQELENGGFAEGSAIDTLVDALNEQVNPGGAGGPFAFANPTGVTAPGDTGGLIGTDAITTGIVYDQTKVRLVHTEFKVFDEASAATTFALADVLNQVASSDDQVGDFQRNRPSVAATFEELDEEGNGTGNTFTVVSSHFKSKGDSNLEDVVLDAQAHVDGGGTVISQADIDALIADPNYDQGDGQAFWNQVRTDASVELLDWIENDYNGGGVSNYVLLGDLNAYAEEDPVDALVDNGGLVDLIDTFVLGGQEEAYSFVFDGQQGTLDQGVADAAFAGLVTAATEWHINADEPDLIGYDTSFNDPAFLNDGVYAASDHDPLIIGLGFPPEILVG